MPIQTISPISASIYESDSLADTVKADPELKEWFSKLNQATRLNETWRSERPINIVSADDSLANVTAADAPFSNVTTAAVDQRSGPNLDGYYRFDVRIGRGATHTGTLRKGRMFKRMYAALKDCGIAHRDPSIPGFCNDDRPECPDHCILPNIVYDKGQLHYAADSSLTLRIKYSYFDIKSHPKIRDLGVSSQQWP